VQVIPYLLKQATVSQQNSVLPYLAKLDESDTLLNLARS
jgi:hypothetical protein